MVVPADDPTNEPIGCVVGKIDYEDEDSDRTPVDPFLYNPNNNNNNNNNTTTTKFDETNNKKNTTNNTNRTAVGYIGMLAVSKEYRRKGIGKALVQRILQRMITQYNCTSVTLETEVSDV